MKPGRRGRYRTEAVKVDSNSSIEDVLAGLRTEAPLRYSTGLEVALRNLRRLMVEGERLDIALREGKLTAEEAKAINANASNQRRWFEAIGMTGAPKRAELKDPDDDGAPL